MRRDPLFRLHPGVQRMLTAVVAMLPLGCYSNQSAIHPAGPAAERIAWLWWLMCWAFTGVFFLVLVLAAVAIFRTRQGEQASPPLGRNGFIVAGGIVLPVVVVIPLLFLSLEASSALQMPDDALTIRVVGHQWWWEVAYPDQNITSANELHIPAGRPVRLELSSADVIHSFWVPQLNGKRDMIPGNPTDFWIQADEPGTYRGQCAEYCGTQHAKMAFVVVALPPAEFDEWVAARQQAEDLGGTPKQQRGLEVFLKAGCAKCHTIGGTKAAGNLGPDLTHIGSRTTLGAGTLPNTRGYLAGWVADSQPLKPGNLMPPSFLSSEDLAALVTYLESLQ